MSVPSLTASQQSLLALANQLITATHEGKVDWHGDTSLTSFTFATGHTGSVTISSMDADGGSPFELVLLNSEGVAIESLETSPPSSIPSIGTSWDGTLRMLYEAARATAVDVNSVIAGIREAIEHPTGLRIVRAIYGAADRNYDVTTTLSALISNNRADFTVDNTTMGGDPAPDVQKTLYVEWVFQGSTSTSTFLEGTHVVLP